ncbi:MAG: hypothetical protein E6Q84_01380 [Thiothrix sp.]|nr:MAG: hypothetical protein E6Q84_01380 [Thiothrix sp.]
MALLPYRVVVSLFNKALNIQNFLIPTRFYFSGRVALYRMALACKKDNTIALLPDYICNVVPKAFQEAGINISSYPTDLYFEPSIQAIQQLAKDQPSVLLCLAPIMGAEGGIAWACSLEGKRWRSQNNITLFIDLSQGISRLKQLSPTDLDQQFVLMASFNNKAFPSVMGAIVMSDIDDPLFITATNAEQLAIVRQLIKRVIQPILSMRRKSKDVYSLEQNQPSAFEYSYCQQFPYTFAHSGASKLQLAIATAGVWFSRYYRWCKQRYVQQGLITPQPTPFYLSAPYILAEPTTAQLKKKAPYACHQQPNCSERPHTPSYHFKGFDD